MGWKHQPDKDPFFWPTRMTHEPHDVHVRHAGRWLKNSHETTKLGLEPQTARWFGDSCVGAPFVQGCTLYIYIPTIYTHYIYIYMVYMKLIIKGTNLLRLAAFSPWTTRLAIRFKKPTLLGGFSWFFMGLDGWLQISRDILVPFGRIWVWCNKLYRHDRHFKWICRQKKWVEAQIVKIFYRKVASNDWLVHCRFEHVSFSISPNWHVCYRRFWFHCTPGLMISPSGCMSMFPTYTPWNCYPENRPSTEETHFFRGFWC